MNDSPKRQTPDLPETEPIGVHNDAGAIAGEMLEPAAAATVDAPELPKKQTLISEFLN